MAEDEKSLSVVPDPEPEPTESVPESVVDTGESAAALPTEGNKDCSEEAQLVEKVVKVPETDDKTTSKEKSEDNVESSDSKKSDAEKQPSDAPMLEYDPKNVQYEGTVAIYTDPSTKYRYKWCTETNKWIPQGAQQEGTLSYGFEDDTHTYTDAEGVKYFWDTGKNAWFPKIDDDFMARYQMSYGFIDNTTPQPPEKKPELEKQVKPVEPPTAQPGEKRKAQQPEATWFEVDESQNTKVYVSNLPTDITEQEFVDFMQKCGLVMRDPSSQKMKVKLYTEPNTDIVKGDALCTYIKVESVELALKILDGADLKGHKVSVERAKFQMKGTYDPKLKPKKKKKKELDKLKKMQEKLFDWRPEKMIGERSKHERVVIVKNLFEPSLFDTEVGLILEFQEDLREECKKCGDVRKVVIYDRHPEGVAQITMKEPEEADAAVLLLNNRWFGKRLLTAEIWDGKIKYKIAETDSQISKRIENWDKFLETEEDKKNSAASADSKQKLDPESKLS